MSTGGASDLGRERSSTGRYAPRGLTRERIVDTALAIVDEQGLAAASMRAVGQRLGVQAMSLYKHVADRDALFDAVVDRIVAELDDDPEVLPAPVDGQWRDWLAGLANGVRRYARGHPHAFPLVATRPPSAPFLNPPLRSLSWVERMLAGLRGAGLNDEQVLFTYRVFNSFLLGYLLLETSAQTLQDPKPGDGAYTTGSVSESDGPEPGEPDADGRGEPAAADNPVPGGLAPTREPAVRARMADADSPERLVAAVGNVDGRVYPTTHDLAAGLAEDRWSVEFDAALGAMLDRVEQFVAEGEHRR